MIEFRFGSLNTSGRIRAGGKKVPITFDKTAAAVRQGFTGAPSGQSAQENAALTRLLALVRRHGGCMTAEQIREKKEK